MQLYLIMLICIMFQLLAIPFTKHDADILVCEMMFSLISLSSLSIMLMNSMMKLIMPSLSNFSKCESVIRKLTSYPYFLVFIIPQPWIPPQALSSQSRTNLLAQPSNERTCCLSTYPYRRSPSTKHLPRCAHKRLVMTYSRRVYGRFNQALLLLTPGQIYRAQY